MRYATAGAFREALEQRLVEHAQKRNVPLVRLRKLVVFDRLMARLTVAAPGRCVLKGAVALQYRIGPQFRTTRDLDLGRQDSEEAATADFLSAQSVDLGDYFALAVERTRQLGLEAKTVAVRYHLGAQLAGRQFEDATVDVGYGDPTLADPELLRGPDLLGFADIPPAEVPVVPLDQHVAEKVHAYTRSYAGGNPSSRVKDLIDLAVMSSVFSFQAGQLRRALATTFVSRGTHVLPPALPSPPPQWRTAYGRMAAEVGMNGDVARGHEQARTFLDPILERIAADGARWDAKRRSWQDLTAIEGGTR